MLPLLVHMGASVIVVQVLIVDMVWVSQSGSIFHLAFLSLHLGLQVTLLV